MFILFPIGKGGRLDAFPVFTAGLIVLNTIAFLLTWPVQARFFADTADTVSVDVLAREMAQLLLDGSDLDVFQRRTVRGALEADAFDGAALQRVFEQARRGNVVLRPSVRHRFDTLYEQYLPLRAAAVRDGRPRVSPFRQWGFSSRGPFFPNILTCQFLHAGVLHLVLNVFFLWVAGGNIEERWGAPLTLGAYLSGGAAGAFAQAVYAGRELAVTGASASVAGLMGAFLIRHIRVPVRVFWLFFPLFTVRFGTCTVPAWAVPALWFLQHLAVEVFTQGGTSGAGYWAHGGGLAAGVLLASFIRTTTAAQMAEQAAEPLPAALDRTVGSAENLIALKEYAAAERMLAGVISADPDHVRAHHALMRLAYEAGDWPRYAQRAVALMRREWERGDLASLRRTLDQALSVIGGAPLPSDALVQLALFCEKLERWEQALLLHRKVLERNPRSPHSLFAAGRILHERLGRPAEARRYFTTLAAPPYDVEWGDAVRRYLT
jgi:membrane associated rhomboid family serine protease